MKAKIIAVDFDGTMCENKWPEIGEANTKLINYLKERKEAGDKLILWTCRIGETLKNAVDWSEKQGIIFDAVNENLPEVLEWMGGDSRKIFADEYIDDRNVLMASCRPKSNMQLWAEREIELACKRERSGSGSKDGDWDYGCSCYESALKALISLYEDGHSGYSFNITKHILNRLMECKPLTPIEDTDDVWNDIGDISGLDGEVANYQCKRMSSLFKYIYSDGTVKFSDINRFYCVNIDTGISYYNGFIDKIMEKLYPIEMPYYPESKSYKVVCEEFLTDQKNGDYDTKGILYVIKPDGERVEINRYFKEGKISFVEITKDEYEGRRLMHQERIERMKNEMQV